MDVLLNFLHIFKYQGIQIRDNDSLSALLAANIQADLLILMSDVDGIYNVSKSECKMSDKVEKNVVIKAIYTVETTLGRWRPNDAHVYIPRQKHD